MKKRRKMQRKLYPSKIAKILGASRMGKVNFPFYYAPQNLDKLRDLVRGRLKKVEEKKNANKKNLAMKKKKKLESPVTLFVALGLIQYETLRTMAWLEKRSFAAVVREALDEFIEKSKKAR